MIKKYFLLFFDQIEEGKTHAFSYVQYYRFGPFCLLFENIPISVIAFIKNLFKSTVFLRYEKKNHRIKITVRNIDSGIWKEKCFSGKNEDRSFV